MKSLAKKRRRTTTANAAITAADNAAISAAASAATVLNSPNQLETPLNFPTMDSLAKKQRRTTAAGRAAATTVFDIPYDCWNEILSHIDNVDNHHYPIHENHRQSLSLTCKHLLAVTNRLPYSLPVNGQLFAHPTLLRRILRRFSSSIQSLDVDPYYAYLDAGFSLLAAEHATTSCLSKLRRVNIPPNAYVPIDGLRRLAEVFFGLKVLEIQGWWTLSDDHLIDICDFFCLIEEIDVSGRNGKLTDLGIVYLAKNLKSLKKINVSGQPLITDESLVALSDHCFSLSDIDIRRCDSVTQHGVGYMLRHCSKLNRFIANTGVPDSLLSLVSFGIKDSVGFARSLSTLDLCAVDVDDSLLISIAEARLPLKKFSIYSCAEFPLQGLTAFLRAYPNLEELELYSTMFLDDQVVEGLVCYFRSLAVIMLGSFALTEATFYLLLKSCPVLEEIRMEDTQLGRGVFSDVLLQSRSIKYLKLSGSWRLSDENLQAIAVMCPNLAHLNVDDCSEITRKGIGGVLQSCCELKHLSVNGFLDSNLFDTDSECLRFKVELLQLQHSKINDNGLSGIAKACPNLMLLNLSHCYRVTTIGVKEVVKCCTRLENIGLWESNTTSDIVMWMVLARPSLKKIVAPLCYRPNISDEEVLFNHGCSVEAVSGF